MPFSTSHPALARALAARNYAVPTPVQSAVNEAGHATRDLLVSAQTGSGKTVAFGLAIAATVLNTADRFEQAAEPLALIIAPTRELALQVQRELVWLFADTGARVITCVGGMEPRTEARNLHAGAHIVVGTPGRLRDHLERRRLDLSKLRTIVLDEADEMLDLGFREDLEFLLDATPPERQTLMFSATVPREIETLAGSYQREAVRIETTQRNEQHADIEYLAIKAAANDVENAVVNLLRFHEARAALVFCATREAVKRMSARLLERGFSAVALSGELTQAERNHALQAVRDGRARVLVATDVAARGLDLPDLALVIHADLPRDPETLLHRSGRTGRAGRKGLCALIVPFHLNRKANQLIGATRVKVAWGSAPTADAIRVKDQERFLADAIFSETPSEEDLTLARALQAGRTADEIAMALVRVHKARLPAPEDLAEDNHLHRGPPSRDDRTGKKQFERRTDYVRPAEGTGAFVPRGDRPARAPRAPEGDQRPMVWFRLNIGRERNADPRWLIPLICKAGNISKAEIGSIKIHDRDTRFQILAEHADQFATAARQSKSKEGHISRVSVYTSADDAAVTQAIGSIAAPAGPVAEPSASMNAAPLMESAPAAMTSTEAPKVWTKKPWDKKPFENKAFEKKPFEKKPYEKKPWDKTGDDTPAGDKKPWVKKPWTEKSVTGKSFKTEGSGSPSGREDRSPVKPGMYAGQKPGQTSSKKPHRKGTAFAGKVGVDGADAGPSATEAPTAVAQAEVAHAPRETASRDRVFSDRPANKRPYQDRTAKTRDTAAKPSGSHFKPKSGEYAAAKSPSKYAQKKKNRPPVAAAE